MLLVRILFFWSDFPLIKQGSAPVKIQKRENFSLLFVQRVDKVLNFLYNKGGKDRKLHKLCCRYAVCFRYFCDVSYPQLRELKPSKKSPSRTSFAYVSYPQLRELKLRHSRTISSSLGSCILPAAAGIETYPCEYTRCPSHVSYPQLRELKHREDTNISNDGDVSYPQLRELKRVGDGDRVIGNGCILPAAAGILF